MTQGQYAVILVHSTSHAVRVEKLLQAGGIASKMIPVPRQISSDCGACLRILRQDVEAEPPTVLSLFFRHSIPFCMKSESYS